MTIGHVEGVAEAHEARGLAAGVDVEHPGQDLGLVGDEADRLAVHAAEAGDDVPGEVGGDLEEIRLVDDLRDQLLHVVGLVRAFRHQGVEGGLGALGVVEAFPHRRLFAVGRGQEIDQPADLGQRLQVVVEGAVGDAGFQGVDPVAAQLLVADLLVDHGFRRHSWPPAIRKGATPPPCRPLF